ncbi:GNAT family N-acetyltransferase [Mucilaginibacter lacusdianchii]|uniref:GNAT family N-acetyltransferase n=1 Tax=Mucilaginibacter lacusdianchii TaxID=2684211 RepID=UPI00131BDD2D|nr:GNAT family N-acetyltransferase [Mucilaginibacter sp. JXJ CY 39]
MVKFAEAEHLETIFKLWGQNRATLGLMPKDAFKECIKKRWLLVALDGEQQVRGYLQFRFTAKTQNLSVVHLCIDKAYRGQGIARSLLDRLVAEYKAKARGVKLNCRSDYTSAIRFWTQYNFQPKAELPSRGADPNIHLITWWFSFGNQDLFSVQQNDKIKAVLDFNIIAKLMEINASGDSKDEITQLQSDWLVTEVDFYRTSETVSEIRRDQNIERRNRSNQYIKTFPELDIDKSSVREVETDLLQLFPGDTDNHRSDRRQLSEAILSSFPYFVTLDDGILKQAGRIQVKHQLKVVTPSTFMAHIDMAVHAEDYYPSRLSGESLTIAKATADEIAALPNLFLNYSAGEKRAVFVGFVNDLVARPTGCLKLIKKDSAIIAMYGYDESQENFLVPIIRTKQNSLRQTIFIQNINDLIKKAIQLGKQFLIVGDPYLTAIEREILTNHGFFEFEQGFIRGVCSGMYDLQRLPAAVNHLCRRIPEMQGLVDAVSATTSTNMLNAYQLEKLLWPVKITDAAIPCYIIPIKQYYAKELFDTKAAKAELFGASPKLIWSQENVYYRHIQPNVETAPARILWYVSAGGSSSRQKSIVATSYLNEVITGPAKELFRKHEKFGVYSWAKDISKLAKGVAGAPIKVLRFSDSEPFERPVPLNAVKKVLKRHRESDNNFQSPLRIKSSTFMEIYAFATGRKNG